MIKVYRCQEKTPIYDANDHLVAINHDRRYFSVFWRGNEKIRWYRAD